MRNEARLLDKTFLSLDLAEERRLVHRDYIAHCFRWSHVVKFLNQKHRYKDAVVLDVGCGKEMPLAKLLYVNKMTPTYYVGVDANKFEIPEMLKVKAMRQWVIKVSKHLGCTDHARFNDALKEKPDDSAAAG